MIDMEKDQVKEILTHKQIEEMEPQFEYITHMVAVYRRALIKQGLSKEVADGATLQFHQNMLHRFFPPQNPFDEILKAMSPKKEDPS